jgi:hypothetical protein
MSHKYKVRQVVRLKHPAYSGRQNADGNTYEVVRLMPPDQTGEPAYRIKLGDTERAVRESEIVPA